MREFSCPACLQVVRAPASREGTRQPCPKCGAEVRWARPIRRKQKHPLFWACAAIAGAIVFVGISAAIYFFLRMDPPTPALQTDFTATGVFRDGDLSFGTPKVTNDYIVANATALTLVVKNRSPGRIYYLPLWADRHESASITDEYGNTFYPTGGRYFRSPLTKDAPPANGNRVDPGANDVLTIEFERLPPSSKRLKIGLPYRGSIVTFSGVPRN